MKKFTAIFLTLTLAAALFAFPAQNAFAEEAAEAAAAQDEMQTENEEQSDEYDEDTNFFTLIETTNLNGEAFDAGSLLNKPIIINVWADWCGPCRMEMPVLTKLSEEYGEEIVLLGLLAEGVQIHEESLERDEEKIKLGLAAQEELGIGFETLVPDEILFSIMYHTQLQAFPTTWFINEKGQLVDIVLGARSENEWREKIDEFISFLEEDSASDL